MKLVMAVSRDGYVARSDHDTMDWLGPDDKALFRALTSVGGECFVGRGTADLMPVRLEGRTLRVLSRSAPGGVRLEHLRSPTFADSWLLGGQAVALAALALGTGIPGRPGMGERPVVREVHLCRSDRCAFPDDRRYFDRITPLLRSHGLEPAMTTKLGDVRHEVWRLEETVPRGA